MSEPFTGWRDPLPRFRPDLTIVRLGLKGRPSTHYVRDPATFEIIELGEEGAFLCRQLDGRSGPEEIRARFEAQFGARLGQESLDVFVDQLARKGMLDGVPRGPQRRTFAEYFDPEVFLPWHSYPLLAGDRFVTALSRRLGWLFSWPVHLLWAAAFLWGVSIYALHFGDFLATVMRNTSLAFFILLVLSSCLLIHSPRLILHGVMCKRYGRRVAEIGVAVLYYILPVVHCDWSDAVWIPDKRRRFWGIAAGLYYQIVLWSVATIGWFVTRPGGAPNTFWLILSTATCLGFFLFVANPLVKMNGYWLLVNWIEVPRLRERALAAFGSWATLRRPSEVFTARERRGFIIYGLLVFGYAALHLVFISYYMWDKMIPLYEGRGALATLALILFVVHKPIVEQLGKMAAVRWLLDPRGGLLRWSVRLAIPAGLVGILCIPYPYRTGGSFRLLPAGRAEVRVEVEGLVEAVFVREGEEVRTGQPIARVSARVHNKNLQATVARLRKIQEELSLLEAARKPEVVEAALADVETAAVQSGWSSAKAERVTRMYTDSLVAQRDYENALWQRDVDEGRLGEAKAGLALVESDVRPALIRAKRAEMEGLQVLVDNYQADVDQTTLTSPIDGRIVTPRVEELVGTYMQPGDRDLIATIEDGRIVQAEVAVPEQDFADVRPGLAVEVVPWGTHDTTFVGRVVMIAPVATPKTVETATAVVARNDDDAVRVVRVLTDIPNPDGSLKAGMTGYAKIATGERPLWDVLFRPLIRWCRVEVWSWIP